MNLSKLWFGLFEIFNTWKRWLWRRSTDDVLNLIYWWCLTMDHVRFLTKCLSFFLSSAIGDVLHLLWKEAFTIGSLICFMIVSLFYEEVRRRCVLHDGFHNISTGHIYIIKSTWCQRWMLWEKSVFKEHRWFYSFLDDISFFAGLV